MSLSRIYSMGLLATDVARLRLGGDATGAARARIHDRLVQLHGLPQKLAQILAPLENTPDPAGGGSRAPATIPYEELLNLIGRAIGPESCAFFCEIDPRGVGASIGQVHRGELVDGRQVAIKVQYPELADELEFDLNSLGWLSRPLSDLRKGYDLAGYRQELAARLHEELDYQREAHATAWFAERIRGWRGVESPTVVWECSGKTVLTTTWLAGERINATAAWPQAARSAAAQTLVRLFFQQVFAWRRLHADPNPGNYRFRLAGDEPIVGVLDFGCMKDLSADFVAALASLLRSVQKGADPATLADGFAAIGFDRAALEPFIDRLPQLASVLFEPLLAVGPFDVRAWHAGSRMAEILGEHRLAFRTAGSAQLLFVLRAYQGLIAQLETLAAPVDWLAAWREVEPFVPANALSFAPAKNAAKCVAQTIATQFLRIRVTEANATKAALCFPARAAAWLAELMPPEVELKLAERAIDVAAIGRQAEAAGFPQGELFALDEGTKCVRVWLE